MAREDEIGEDYPHAPAPDAGAPASTPYSGGPYGSEPTPGTADHPSPNPYQAHSPQPPPPPNTPPRWEPNQAPAPNPYLSYTPAKPPRKKRPLLRIVIIGVAVAAMAVFNALTDDDSGSTADPAPTPEPTPDLENAWIITPPEATGSDDAAEFLIGADGAFTGPPFIATEEAWVVLAGPADARSASTVVGVDPQSGATLWQHDLAAGLCGIEAVDGQVGCLYRADGGWSGMVIDVATGEIAQDWQTTAIGSARMVRFTEAGLLVVGELEGEAPHAMVTLIEPDGALGWQVDLADVENSELLFDTFLQEEMQGEESPDPQMERARWRELEGPHVLLWSTPGAAVIDTATGDVVAHACRRATASVDHYYCATDDGIVRHELDGSPAWTLPHLDLAIPPDTSPARPVALDSQGQVMAVDWETPQAEGTVITLRPQSGGFTNMQLPPTAGGSPQHYTVRGEETLIGLEPDADALRWQLDLTERGYISDVFAVGDILVTDSFPLLGIDPATGEVLWERRNFSGLYLQVIEDDTLASLGFDELVRFELPR
ncbi:PQQ-binding-like beta-propeller repeat protein [Ruania alba]|uniref:PQQ-binding-like beta-propeller repeat protein n=1 Tax=Ruania alba TaxID=648782 RepID=A0A1H5NI27_9MICO|nr:PQQ-binding-like beta-propeller repeat protein [Ruania alba]SEF00521.1 hypothetical protein SAMN04488554_4302 [Ruania alba]